MCLVLGARLVSIHCDCGLGLAFGEELECVYTRSSGVASTGAVVIATYS